MSFETIEKEVLGDKLDGIRFTDNEGEVLEIYSTMNDNDPKFVFFVPDKDNPIDGTYIAVIGQVDCTMLYAFMCNVMAR